MANLSPLALALVLLSLLYGVSARCGQQNLVMVQVGGVRLRGQAIYAYAMPRPQGLEVVVQGGNPRHSLDGMDALLFEGPRHAGLSTGEHFVARQNFRPSFELVDPASPLAVLAAHHNSLSEIDRYHAARARMLDRLFQQAQRQQELVASGVVVVEKPLSEEEDAAARMQSNLAEEAEPMSLLDTLQNKALLSLAGCLTVGMAVSLMLAVLVSCITSLMSTNEGEASIVLLTPADVNTPLLATEEVQMQAEPVVEEHENPLQAYQPPTVPADRA